MLVLKSEGWNRPCNTIILSAFDLFVIPISSSSFQDNAYIYERGV